MSVIRYLTAEEVLRLHALVIQRSGGSAGLRDVSIVESAVAQPQQKFGGEDPYPTLVAEAAALAHALVLGHPFVDGSKRVGHAAMETFLMLNGREVEANVDEQEQLFLRLAGGEMSREELTAWVEAHAVPLG